MTTKEQSNTGNHKQFIEREFKEVNGGVWDDLGFYTTPNGSKKLLMKVSGTLMVCILTGKE